MYSALQSDRDKARFMARTSPGASTPRPIPLKSMESSLSNATNAIEDDELSKGWQNNSTATKGDCGNVRQRLPYGEKVNSRMLTKDT